MYQSIQNSFVEMQAIITEFELVIRSKATILGPESTKIFLTWKKRLFFRTDK